MKKLSFSYFSILITAFIAVVFFQGCATSVHTTNVLNDNNNINNNLIDDSPIGKICVNDKEYLEDIIIALSTITNKKIHFDSFDKNSSKRNILYFKGQTCFGSINELSEYIESTTPYKLSISLNDEKGIFINGKKINDVISFLNNKNQTMTIKLLDENILLYSNLNEMVYNFENLKNIILKNTPYQLVKVNQINMVDYYVLKYKSITTTNANSLKSLKENLTFANEITKGNKNTILVDRLKSVTENINEFSKDYELN